MSYGQIVQDVGGLSIPPHDYVGHSVQLQRQATGPQDVVHRIGGRRRWNEW